MLESECITSSRDSSNLIRWMKMDPALRVFGGVLDELWSDRGVVNASPGEWLAMHDIASLLRLGPVQFVIADIGLPLRWIDLASCYRFWKEDVKPHLVPPGAAVRLEDMPGEYFYRAQQWLPADTSAPVILLFRHH